MKSMGTRLFLQEFTFTILLVFLTSCMGRKNDRFSIEGNWHPKYIKNLSEDYSEMYIDHKNIYHFRRSDGSIYARNYSIKGSEIFISNNNDTTLESIGVISILKDTFFINNSAGESAFIKTKDSVSFENYYLKEIDLREYSNAYYKRAAKWNQQWIYYK